MYNGSPPLIRPPYLTNNGATLEGVGAFGKKIIHKDFWPHKIRTTPSVDRVVTKRGATVLQEWIQFIYIHNLPLGF